MLDERLRPLKERVLLPAANAIGARVHPTVVTIAGLLMGLAAATAAAYGAYRIGLALWIANRVLDGLDGTLARAHGTQSDLGGYVDIVVDFVVYAAVPLGLVLGVSHDARATLAVAALAMVASFFVNAASWMYLAAILERRGLGAAARGEMTTITMPGGLVGGTETVVFYLLFFALPGMLVPLFALMTLLVMLTIVQRLLWAWRHL